MGLSPEIFTQLIDDLLGWSSYPDVIHVDNNQTVVTIQETWVLFGFLKAESLEGLDHVLVPQFWRN